MYDSVREGFGSTHVGRHHHGPCGDYYIGHTAFQNPLIEVVTGRRECLCKQGLDGQILARHMDGVLDSNFLTATEDTFESKTRDDNNCHIWSSQTTFLIWYKRLTEKVWLR